MEDKNVTVLLIDDNEVDVMGVRRAFKKINFDKKIVVATDGIEGLAALRRATDVQKPYLILLDLNMPRMNGIEFLRELRSDANLSKAIVFVLTTSNARDDKVQAFEHNIAGYIVKGKAEQGFIDAAELLERYTEVCEIL